jgi:hypothetical protein
MENADSVQPGVGDRREDDARERTREHGGNTSTNSIRTFPLAHNGSPPLSVLEIPIGTRRQVPHISFLRCGFYFLPIYPLKMVCGINFQ